jgi:phosphatidylserine decarboxylase
VRIAPEGWPFIGAVSLLAGVALVAAARLDGAIWWTAAALLVITAAWMGWFFRDPVRHGPRDARLLLAPADGKVVSVIDTDEPLYLQSASRRVSIFLNIFDVHVNRYPASGLVELYRHERGTFAHAATEQASRANERASLGIQTARGRMLVRQIAGRVARRIVTDHREGADVEQGERLGLIRFGSRVDLFVPPAVTIAVAPGTRVRAGLTVLGEWSA